MIVITEKEKNLNTGDKKKCVTTTEYFVDFVRAFNTFTDRLTDDSFIERLVRESQVEFRTVKDSIKYTLRVEFR